MNDLDAAGATPTEQVMHFLRGLIADPVAIAIHMDETPIRVLNGRTINAALADGDVEKVLRYLQTISAGQNG